MANLLINDITYPNIDTVRIPKTTGGLATFTLSDYPPSTYTKLRCLIGSGTQWIDAWDNITYPSSASDGYEFYIKFAPINDASLRIIFGDGKGTNVMNRVYRQAGASTTTLNTAENMSTVSGIADGQIVEYHSDGSTFTINGEAHTSRISELASFTQEKHLILFGGNAGDNTAEQKTIATMKLYECYYKYNGEFIFYYMPYLDANNVPCLVDIINETVKYNSGTGSFTYETI